MKIDQTYYMEEACGIFALALNKTLGYEIAYLTDEDELWDEGTGVPSVAHVFAITPNNEAVDAEGVKSIAQIRAHYFDLQAPSVRESSPREIAALSGDDDSNPLCSIDKEDFDNAVEEIQSNPEKYGASSLKHLIESMVREVLEEAGHPRGRRHNWVPSFEQWLQHAGGDDFLELEYDGYADVDEPDEREEALEEAREKTYEKFEEWSTKYEEFGNPETLYRCVSVADISDINLTSLGKYWADYHSFESCYLSDDASVSKFVIVAAVTNNAIDWMKTFDANMSSYGTDESEVTLVPGAKVKILSIDDQQGKSHKPSSRIGVI